MRLTRCFPVVVCLCTALAQDNSPAQGGADDATPRHEVIVVTGSYEPIPLDEADRSVRVIGASGDMPLLTHSLSDLLQLDPSIDLRQRGPHNIQGDLSIRGSTFGQTLVLVDGLRMNDVQSGHHNLNLPVPLEALDRVEVLKGSGSTFYGSDAVGGVVNFLTRAPELNAFRLGGAVGNFGANQQRASISLARRWWSEQLTFYRDFSTGFIENRDYRNLSLSSRTGFRTRLGDSSIVLAHSDRPFGAEQYYGNYNSWERTKAWYAAGRQSFGEQTGASFSYRRHTDLFVLFRDRPQVFTNRHESHTWQANVRRWDRISANTKLHYGLEGLFDGVDSNNLGAHSRSRGAAYAALDMRALDRFSFTLGGRYEVYSSRNGQFSPTAAAGAWIHSRVKLRASVSRAFRLPTFTDLYYHDPANIGSPDLRPESAWNYEGGIDVHLGGDWKAEFTVFHRRERDGIDYVRNSPADIWRATNFQRLDFTGVEAGVTAVFAKVHRVEFRYTGLHGAQDALTGAQSKYVFNYPSHSGLVTWQAALPGGIVARTRLGALQRLERDPYAVWDLYVARARGRVQPFLQFTNLTATNYEEILGVVMPRRGILGGVEIAVFGPR